MYTDLLRSIAFLSPLSDEDLVEKMNHAGCPVKRRTITKYRQMAHIPSSRERKDWAASRS